MEKKSLLKSFFKKKDNQEKETGHKTEFRLMNGYNATYTQIGDEVFDTKVARQCIDRIATHCAKLEPKHIKDNLGNVQNSNLNYLLSHRPNPVNNTFDFLYRVFSLLYTDSNSFIYIAKDKKGMITGLYPVLATKYELLEDYDGVVWLEFRFINGQKYEIPYKEVAHLRLFYNRNDIFGTNDNILSTDLETVHTAAEGTKNAIKTSTSLRGILKYQNSQIKEKDLVKNKNDFVNDYLNLENSSGIAALDGKAEFKPIEMKPITLDAEQLKQVNYNVYDYFGVSDKIVTNSFKEDEWNAFYEGVVEARAIQLGQELTNKIFNTKAIKEGHQIVLSTNRLMYASLDSKVNLLHKVASFGMIKTDEGRAILGLPPLGGEEGERIIQSLNNVDSSIANEYQLGKNKE